MNIDSVCKVGKGVNIKREKGSDDIEIVIAHLKFDELIIPREIIDACLLRKEGWAQTSLYDELGAPIARMDIGLPNFTAYVTGVLRGAKEDEAIHLQQATLTNVKFSLSVLGAMLSGELSWAVAGDEVSDLEPLLGRICAAVWVIDSGEKQADMLKAA